MRFFYYLFIIVLCSPAISFAALETGKCSSDGYTVATVNGVLTNEDGAINNMEALMKKVGFISNGQKIDYQYLLNPIHIAGLGDAVMVLYQKFFESETVKDYDLVEMLKDASAKVKTQKLLLVAHSQGNFYANSFYDVVAGQVGGLSAQSIGVYSVANPASRVAGNGKWLTSDTDHVISGLVKNVMFLRKIMPTNTHIEEVAGGMDPMFGHSFADVYLKYRSTEIVAGIQASLDKLSADPERRADTLCIDSPNLSFIHKLEGVTLAIVDPVATVAKTTVVIVGKVAINTVVDVVQGAVFVVKTTVNAGIATAVWTYNTTVAVGSAAVNTAVAVASTISAGVTSLVNGTGNLAAGNSAAAILATQTQAQAQKQSPQTLPPATMPSPATQKTPSKTLSGQIPGFDPTVSVRPAPASAPTTASPTTKPSAPKLIFVGMSGAGFGGGGGAPPQVLGTTVVTNEISSEPDVGSGGGGSGPETILQTPTLSVPQCAYSIATSTEGCLLATTTVRFEWAPVAGAAYYAINKNGTYATTTELFADITASDFSDYTFDISAVDAGGSVSATSTKTVSVATIPIAINEIAWMGTVASANDEWFEIKNNTAHTIDLSQWELNAKDGTPHVKLAGAILPRAYLVFERTSNTTIADVAAHQVYTGALGNVGEQLNLSYASTTLDQTPDGAWVAGTTTTKSTMERYSSKVLGTDPLNWGTNLGYIKNGTDANGNAISGTPGAQNSVSTLINKGQDITSDLTLTNTEERYVVTGTLNVSASSTLTIAPGVNIKFREEDWWHPAQIEVNGALDVQGTAENPVTFSSFTSTPTGSVELRSTATSSIYSASFNTTEWGINAYGGTTDITDSSFANVKYEAVGVYSGAHVSVASTTISNITRGDAIGVYDSSTLEVASTTIDGVLRGNGIAVYDSELLISSSTIRNVDDSGLSLSNASSTILNVAVENAGWEGIGVHQGTATIIDTTVSGATGWAGISVSVPVEPVVITGGEVTGNTVGISMDAGSAVITDVSVHDNGTSDADNIVVW